MAIKKYDSDGKTYWQVYLNIRSKIDPTIRKQTKIKWIESEREARSTERKLLRSIGAEIALLEKQGLSWGQVVTAWEHEVRTNRNRYTQTQATILDYVRLTKKWTASWISRRASEISRADAREVMRDLESEGRSRWSQEKFRTAVNTIYQWGIEEGFIKGISQSPVYGVKVTAPKAEKVPDILTLSEIRKLLFESKQTNHPWYPIWAMALLTGMRNGELHALLWADVDLENRKILVNKSYQTKGRYVKSTKSGEWRTVPISDELFELLVHLKQNCEGKKHVLPRSRKWDVGGQAEILRQFCRGIGINPIRFHALRACFATQLLAHDVAPARVMKICGWKELKTMQYYIRMAGIEEDGATQVLKVLPSDAAVMGEIVSIIRDKKK